QAGDAWSERTGRGSAAAAAPGRAAHSLAGRGESLHGLDGSGLSALDSRPVQPFTVFAQTGESRKPKVGRPKVESRSYLESEAAGEPRDARRQDPAVHAGGIEICRTRGVEQCVRRIRIQHVEHVNAQSELRALDREVFAQPDVEDVERRADFRAVRLDADICGAELRDRRAAVRIHGAEQDRALSYGALLRLHVGGGEQIVGQAVADLE